MARRDISFHVSHPSPGIYGPRCVNTAVSSRITRAFCVDTTRQEVCEQTHYPSATRRFANIKAPCVVALPTCPLGAQSRNASNCNCGLAADENTSHTYGGRKLRYRAKIVTHGTKSFRQTSPETVAKTNYRLSQKLTSKASSLSCAAGVTTGRYTPQKGADFDACSKDLSPGLLRAHAGVEMGKGQQRDFQLSKATA